MGIFGGTFDPVHDGHLQVADAVRRQLPMDKVLFIPVSVPLLREEPLADPVHRLEMVRLAVDGWPGFEADDREIRRAGPSYTVLTLEELRQDWPTLPLCLILGIDTVLRLTEWYRRIAGTGPHRSYGPAGLAFPCRSARLVDTGQGRHGR